MHANALELALEVPAEENQIGFRLDKIEVFNWGTFHQHIWSIEPNGQNALLTGDIGSGKSTLVDAITTLLVPANRVSYNKAAGASSKERSLRSYVLGYYKSERTEMNLHAKPVALRGRDTYSVILGRFRNRAFKQVVTIAQVFWQKDVVGQPSRFYIVADKALSIAEHFNQFGEDILQLKKQLRRQDGIELFDSFPPYCAAFRRRFGIENDQALELFHQTVSMKSVGNLTEFVREHMLEEFDVRPRIDALLNHFDNLTHAHNAVLNAKKQVSILTPLATDLDKQTKLNQTREAWRCCRENLRVYFSTLKSDLLLARIERYTIEYDKITAQVRSSEQDKTDLQLERDQLKKEIYDNGGDRLERIKIDIKRTEQEFERRKIRYHDYEKLTKTVSLKPPESIDQFQDNQTFFIKQLNDFEPRSTQLQNDRTEIEVNARQLNDQMTVIKHEIESLEHRRSNIDSKSVSIRNALCQALSIEDDALPFVGELIQVRPEESQWEGAAERLLRNFALSLLVPERYYSAVSEWVNQTNLRGRLVYYKINQNKKQNQAIQNITPSSLVSKLMIKPSSEFYTWLETELAKRFDYVCCDTLEQFRREKQAISQSGQIKAFGQRHEKDDRFQITDRGRYVLGWDNKDKLELLKQQRVTLKDQQTVTSDSITALIKQQKTMNDEKTTYTLLNSLANFDDIHWHPIETQLSQLHSELEQLQASSNILKMLTEKLSTLECNLGQLENKLDEKKALASKTDEKLNQANKMLEECRELIRQVESKILAEMIEQLDAFRHDAVGEHKLTVESCDNTQQKMREWLQKQIDGDDKRLKTIEERIIKCMEQYRWEYPAETQEIDANMAAADEYKSILDNLVADDLPRFEIRFKTLLNENTIREIANFQSQLNREKQLIKERIQRINESLADIEYNKGRFIRLEMLDSQDFEVRDFRTELRSCTEGALLGSDAEHYAEEKFLQVKQIVDRFTGREGHVDLDKRWTNKVTDVRNWFVFGASERWAEDDSEYEHYSDSGGKSGGQKEKLAYTVLAASLAYQFGLDWRIAHSRSFRFVVIDEAFGRGSDESARFALNLFKKLNLQLLIVTPLQKIHVIEPYVSSVGFVSNQEGCQSQIRMLSISEYQKQRDLHQRAVRDAN